ncbi:MAG: hypothetical protein QGI68_19120, partial [Pseudomonadales bacterium]|nr:hypothetical protein [Pseudomonadales bacterium]
SNIKLQKERYTTIETCRLAFPFERNRGPNRTTVAGVETELLVYHFIDDKLYRISAFFEQDGYSDVKRALSAKYGNPSSTNVHEYQNAYGATFSGESLSWHRGVSSIDFIERYSKYSALFFKHAELDSEAALRRPPADISDL